MCTLVCVFICACASALVFVVVLGCVCDVLLCELCVVYECVLIACILYVLGLARIREILSAG